MIDKNLKTFDRQMIENSLLWAITYNDLIEKIKLEYLYKKIVVSKLNKKGIDIYCELKKLDLLNYVLNTQNLKESIQENNINNINKLKIKLKKYL